MPQLQTVDLSPTPYQGRETNLEKTLGAFVNRQKENRDTDELSKIYKQYQDDGKNIDNALQSLQTNPNLSPSRRVEATNQMLELRKQNNTLQQAVAKRQAVQDKADKKAQDEQATLETNRQYLAELEQERGLAPGSLAKFEKQPGLADKLNKPVKGNQADREIDPEQSRRMDHVENSDAFKTASIPEKSTLYRKAGVSASNIDSALKPLIEQAKIDAKTPNLDLERDRQLNTTQAKEDSDFYNEQMEQFPQLESERRTLDRAAELNEEGVTGHISDQVLEKAGLLQYTSDGRREFTSLAKDAVKNQNIKSIIGSQISQMEFGFFRDATINPNFSKEANARIIKKEGLANRYKQLYADITQNLAEQNGGKPPPYFRAKVNDEYRKQSAKISKELQVVASEFEAIQNVPTGYILMYDPQRRPLHVPANEAKKYEDLRATQT